MNSSNLAERLEEFESVIDSLRLTPATTSRVFTGEELPAAPAETTRPVRRATRVRAIQTRDQGLRGFRVF